MILSDWKATNTQKTDRMNTAQPIIIQYMDGILNTIYPEEIAGMELAYPAKNWDER